MARSVLSNYHRMGTIALQAPTMQTQQWYIATIEYKLLTIAERNNAVHNIKRLIAQHNTLNVADVWVTLESGSLIVKAEVDSKSKISRWPETTELMAAITQTQQSDSHGATIRKFRENFQISKVYIIDYEYPDTSLI